MKQVAQNSSRLPIVGLFIVFCLLGATYSYAKLKNITVDAVQKQYGLFLSPQQKLELALANTSSLETLYAQYDSEVVSTITGNKGVSRAINSNMRGYLAGSTDGEVSKMEMKISSDLSGNLEVVIGLIATEENIYVSGPATQGKWLHFEKAAFEKMDEAGQEDASLYGFNILATLMDESNALIRGIDSDSMEYLGKQVVGGKNLDMYSVEISIPKYLEALKLSSETSENDFKDSEQILNSAVIATDLYVDPDKNYITKLVIRAKNLTQIISDEQSKQSGIISNTHDISLTADLSRFNLETNISAPPAEDIIESDESVLGVTSDFDISKYYQLF